MNYKSSIEIRQMFFDFFKMKKHKILPSSSLVLKNDPTLLFTNAGMNQFKDFFLVPSSSKYSRVVTIQKCLRVGGKDNDLDKVGYTNYHHTFFEMLGNFSFGDYFKRDAIRYAWELLTSKEWFNLEVKKIWVTIHYEDNETYNIWIKDIGIDKSHIIKKKNYSKSSISDNFWKMGDTGPCGPCTEIFYNIQENLSHSCINQLDIDDRDRFIEIWNIVFIEFNRQLDGSLLKLKKPSIDTGMGLERISAILQNVDSSYETDIFRELLLCIAKTLNYNDIRHRSLKVLSDHIRSVSLLIDDGILPSNSGRGYVLRRIIRRAIRHGYMLGIKEIFFYRLVDPFIKVVGNIFQTLNEKNVFIRNIIKNEEKKFNLTLSNGMKILIKELEKVKDNILSGKIIFNLYDTYGFPFDLSFEICKERNIRISKSDFLLAMQNQKNQSKQSNIRFSSYQKLINLNYNTVFKGYNSFKLKSIVICIINHNNKIVDILNKNESGIIIIDQTPFYMESGGQIGDTGLLYNDQSKFLVSNTQKYGKTILHFGKLIFGKIKKNDVIKAEIDFYRRQAISINHSATHLLHATLLYMFGKHILQKGSFINENYFRFDFTHFKNITNMDLDKIENIVNLEIQKNYPICSKIISIDKAKKSGAIGLVDKEYEEKVRVVDMGNKFSLELCGGTHVERTGDIGFFHIKRKENIGSGIYRIEGITGNTAVNYVLEKLSLLNSIKKEINVNDEKLLKKIKDILNKNYNFEKKINKYKKNRVDKKVMDLIKKNKCINNVNILVQSLKNFEQKELYLIIRKLKEQLRISIIVLFSIREKNFFVISSVSKKIINKISSNEIILFINKKIHIKGGGNVEIAQARGDKIKNLSIILTSIEKWINLKII
ncbi:MAG: alanine--tRNA ligase [Arsenophonus sp.]|nr:MAG: alanine--tRNA ligase [Arsenophonus sp.]